jgi:hypothetical protein
VLQPRAGQLVQVSSAAATVQLRADSFGQYFAKERAESNCSTCKSLHKVDVLLLLSLLVAVLQKQGGLSFRPNALTMDALWYCEVCYHSEQAITMVLLVHVVLQLFLGL